MAIPQFFNPFAHLVWFQVLVTNNKVAMNIHVKSVYEHMFSFPLSKYLVVEWHGCIEGVKLFKKPPNCFQFN